MVILSVLCHCSWDVYETSSSVSLAFPLLPPQVLCSTPLLRVNRPLRANPLSDLYLNGHTFSLGRTTLWKPKWGPGPWLPWGSSSWNPNSGSQVDPVVSERDLGHRGDPPAPPCVLSSLTMWEVQILAAAPLQCYCKVTAEYHAISL